MTSNKQDKLKEIEKFDKDTELWETRQLGASAEHAVPISDEEEKEIDDAMGLQLLSFRIQKSIIEQLRQLSKLEGIGYQPLMRQVLTKYVRENEHRLEPLLTPHQSSEKAEQLLTQALNYKEIIPTLGPISKERLRAESDYSTALGNANALYGQALEKCADPVLKKHIKLRLNQIGSLLDEDLPGFHDKKYDKARKKAAS